MVLATKILQLRRILNCFSPTVSQHNHMFAYIIYIIYFTPFLSI